MQPHIGLSAPARRAFAVVDELADLVARDAVDLVRGAPHHVDDAYEALVRPACQRHRRVLEEHLQALAIRRHFAEVAHAEGLQVGLEDLAAGAFVQPLQRGGVRHRHEVRHLPPADQAGFGSRCGAVDDRRLGRARVCRGQLQGLGQLIDPGGQRHRDAARGKGPGLLELADLVAGPVRRREGPGALGPGHRRPPRPRVIPTRSDVQSSGAADSAVLMATPARQCSIRSTNRCPTPEIPTRMAWTPLATGVAADAPASPVTGTRERPLAELVADASKMAPERASATC